MTVINPWVFYWMNVVDAIVIAAVTAVIVLITAMLIYISCTALAYEEIDMRIVKRFALGIIAATVVATFVPGSGTITKMIIAENVTYERVEGAADVVQDVYEDIMALFEDGGKDG